MPRTSKVRRLPPEIRSEVDRLLNAFVPLDEIMAKLRELGVEGVSRSGLGRYKQDIDRVGERMRRSNEISNAFVEKLGSAPEGKQGRMLIEMLRSVIFDLLLASDDGSGTGDVAGIARAITLDPTIIMRLAKSLKDLASAQKSEADFVLIVRRQIEAEQEKKLKKLESEADKPGAATRGFDPATLKRVREEIYGLPSA